MVDARSPAAKRLASPSWLDGRLVLGVLLVLVSVVVGARVLSSADRSTSVWVTTRALAPGAQLADDDLELGRVRLFGATSGYLSGPKPVGYVLLRSVGAGELLPEAALGRPGEDVDYRAVTVPVSAGHLAPDLRAGQQVDVYVTPEGARGAPAAATAPRLVLAGVTVLQRPSEGSAEGDEAVVLQVRPDQVLVVLAAVDAGSIDLVRVPTAAEVDVELTPAG